MDRRPITQDGTTREAFWRWLADAFAMPALLATPPRAAADIAPLPSRLDDAARQKLAAQLGTSAIRQDNAARIAKAAGRELAGQLRVRTGDLSLAPDAVLYPYAEQDVLAVLRLCAELDIAVVPPGAGAGIVLDMSRMDRVTAIDLTSGLAQAEGGISGEELERHLAARGMTLDHDADSFAFSTLGARIMQDDPGPDAWLRGVRLATPQGLLEAWEDSGPGLMRIARGSRSALGIVTGASLRIRALPANNEFRRYLFADFASGIAAVREAARTDIAHVSLRLSDDGETRFVEKLRQRDGDLWARFFEIYRAVRRFDGNAALLEAGFSGSENDNKESRKRLDAMARRLGAIALGEQPEWPGPIMLPARCEALLDRGVGVDSIVMDATWAQLPAMYVAVRAALKQTMRARVPRAGAGGMVLCHVAHARSDA
ncbi:MAG TPA: FAD-binding oxidoreductase, partial [Rhizomicrobium sp.]|nr:FAD-binding oxidoreductase [Rhizomicrobium sp.]